MYNHVWYIFASAVTRWSKWSIIHACLLSVQWSMTIFVLNFLFGGLQCSQISIMLKMIKLCLKWPLLLNKFVMSILLLCSPPKKLTQHGFTKGHQILCMSKIISFDRKIYKIYFLILQGAYKGPLMNSEHLAGILAIVVFYVAYTSKSKLLA